MATTAEIRTVLFIVAPEFVTVDSGKLSTINSNIDLFKTQVNETALGNNYKITVAYLVAFQLTNQNFSVDVSPPTTAPTDTSSPNKVIFKKAKNMEIRYSDNSIKRSENIKDIYDTNKYGKLYKEYMNTAVCLPFAIG